MNLQWWLLNLTENNWFVPFVQRDIVTKSSLVFYNAGKNLQYAQINRDVHKIDFFCIFNFNSLNFLLIQKTLFIYKSPLILKLFIKTYPTNKNVLTQLAPSCILTLWLIRALYIHIYTIQSCISNIIKLHEYMFITNN